MPTIEINRRRLAYLDTGSGVPILFGHSYLWDARMWQPQLEALSGRFRCIVPDLWGHGQSDPPPEGRVYSVDRLASDYRRLLEALGVDRCLAVGLSVGGMWAHRLAVSAPQCVRGLLLAGTDAGDEPTESRQRFFGMIERVAAEGSFPPEMAGQLLPLFFADPTLHNPPPFVEEFRRALIGLSPERLPGILAIGRGVFGRPNRLRRLKDIACPATVVVGEQDRSRPLFEARRMAEAIPGAELHVLPRAGHICNLEAPEAFTRLIEELARRAAV